MELKQIAVVVGYFPTVSETFIVNQVNALIESGNLVTLYSYNNTKYKQIHQSLKKHDLINKVNYFKKPPVSKIKRFIVFLQWILRYLHQLDWSLLFKTLNIFKYGKEAYTLKLFYEAQWFILQNDFDIIHAHFGQNAKRIAHLKSLNFLSIKTALVSTFHGYDLIPNNIEFYRKEYINLLEQSEVLTVNTKYLKNILLKLNKNLKNIEILPVGLDTNYFTPQRQIKERRYFDILFCGKLMPLKGPDIAIAIVKELHNLGYNNVRLHIIGEGRLRPLLEDKIKTYGFEDIVFLCGALAQEAVKKQLEHADAFLLPGIHDPETGRAETQGLVIQEAQAMGLPVIVSDAGGMKHGLLPNETGFVVPEHNIKLFAKAIEKLILNEDLKKDMGNKGAIFVRENFDNTVLLKKLLIIYNLVLKSTNYIDN